MTRDTISKVYPLIPEDDEASKGSLFYGSSGDGRPGILVVMLLPFPFVMNDEGGERRVTQMRKGIIKIPGTTDECMDGRR